ncbi:MAG: cell division protein FtsA [Cellulosilyticum sp.]|nr:cell division protein FtsA [Cellulosilyticum sp.]
MKAYLKETLCFGLDIGTRTVVGVVGYRDGDEFVLVDYECRAHEERAMMDGQIHDIQKVARVVYEVKIALEKRLGIMFKEVAIAAAGRALTTQMVEVVQNFDEMHEVTLADIHHLELEGVEKAKIKQQEMGTETEYYCVAYSVVQYYLEDYIIANLEGHKGHQIRAKMIATFLPKQVIDSLYAVTERAELTVSHLTLEPIAAMNAVIPEQIRLLNLALVDIGAGTSDIAITKEGSVAAYGMIPNAGDEVTEAIVHKYLVDFNTAETIKKQVIDHATVEFTDIIGISHSVPAEEIGKVIESTIDAMTCQIAERILRLNGDTSPNAVFCVGGGSQMYHVTQKIAQHLGLSEERVAVRSTKHLVKFKDEVGMVDSPEMITPLGICMTMIQDKFNQFTFVTVNGQKVQLLNAKKLTILDAIIAVGIEHSAIFPKKGNTLMFKLNGERQRIKGENGVPATILLNGQEASIQEHIKDGDILQVELAINGMAPELTIDTFVEVEKRINLEDQTYVLPLVKVNGQLVSRSYKILPSDEVEVVHIHTLEDLLSALEISMDNKCITKEFVPLKGDYVLQEWDHLLIDIIDSKQMHEEDHDLVKQSVVELEEDSNEIPYEVIEDMNSLEVKDVKKSESMYITVNGEVVTLPVKESAYIFASIFDHIAFDLSKPQGTIQLVRNNQAAALTDILRDGDQLEIYWKK